MTSHRARFVLAAMLVALHLLAGVSRAELVFLTSGRTLSVKSHRVDGDTIVLNLRAGGQIACEARLVDRIEADEVPHPEPVAAAAEAPLAGARPFGDIIETVAAQQGVEPRLVHALIQVESAYQSQARSRKGAMGLMQLMPDTARRYSVSNAYDPRANIEAGVRHLKSLLGRFELPLALAAYNAGEAAVERFGGIPPYPETQNYVRQVMRLFGAKR
jgi:soluble lytic murein transglycosylase-like protein